MQISDLEIVLKTSQLGNITAAARHFDMQIATASAAIKRVEAFLGFTLFIRTTRKLKLSSEGEQYLPQCEQAIEILRSARENINADQLEIKGDIRLTSSSDLGRNVLAPMLDDMLERYPELNLALILNDKNIDFYHNSVDMALRYGRPQDSSMVAFKICDVPRVLIASPSYVQSHPTIKHPSDLEDHEGLFYRIADITYNKWMFSKGTEIVKVKMKGRRVANDGDMIRRWCVGGHGVTLKSYLDIYKDLRKGHLVEIMPDYRSTPTELWLVCPQRSVVGPLTRLVRDELREYFARFEPLNTLQERKKR
jgi:DNA-binding transcriptional LysR family regulator